MNSILFSRGNLFDMASESFRYIDALRAKIRLLECEIKTLARLRDRLNGNLRLAAQRHLNEALALKVKLDRELRAYRGEA